MHVVNADGYSWWGDHDVAYGMTQGDGPSPRGTTACRPTWPPAQPSSSASPATAAETKSDERRERRPAMTDAPTTSGRRWPWRAALVGIAACVAVALPADILCNCPVGPVIGGGVGGGLGAWLARQSRTPAPPPPRRAWLWRRFGR